MRVLLLLRGSAGCGKSTWIEQNGLKPYTLSADDIRLLCQSPIMQVDGSPAISQANDNVVWKTLYNILEVRMQRGEFTVIDATNSKTSEINRYKNMCDTYRYRIYCVDFTDIPIEETKRRNANREPLKRVPESVIDKFYSRFTTQKIPAGVKVIKPDELNTIWYKMVDFSEYKKIHVFGDIHGCNTVLQEYFTNNGGLKDDEFYLFTGDYTDRGCENVDVLKFLMSICEKKNVLLLEGNHECYHKDTEVLTKNGWKLLKDVDIENDYVAQFNINNNIIDFVKPIEKITNYSKKLISIEGYDTKQMVTPNHDVVYGNEKIKAANFLHYKELTQQKFTLSGYSNDIAYDIDDNILKLLVWIVADGTIVDDRRYIVNSTKRRIQFKLSREDKINNLTELLNNMKIKYTIKPVGNKREDRKQPYVIRIYGDTARFYCDNLLNGIKCFPLFFRELNRRQAILVLEELLKTDATAKSLIKISWSSIEKTNVDIIQEMCIRNGISCTYKLNNNNQGYNKNGKIYSVTIKPYGTFTSNQISVLEVEYNDNVYCLTMPKGTLITRLEGKVAFSGNCHLFLYANGCPSPSKEFEFYTKKQLEASDIDNKSLRKFCRKFGQCAYFKYNDKVFFVSHGGIASIPDNLTFMATEQMIKGVGTYKECEAVEATFTASTPDNYVQIHGHRNVKSLPIKSDDKNYNLEGKIEFGGHLRVVQINADGIHTFELQNTVFNPPEIVEERKDVMSSSVADVILQLRSNSLVTEKKFDNISSFNFTRDAFEKKQWNDQTVTARGLYIDTEKAKVVARGYPKFFNVNERPETKLEMLQYKLQFPVTAYVKENGYLGIVSYNEYTDDLFITTKSNPEGCYAEWLKEMIYHKISPENIEKIKSYIKENNVSFVFECVDMKNDPHIIEYSENRLYLLDVINNDIKFSKYEYPALCNIASQLGLTPKTKAYEITNWQDFYDWYYDVLKEDYTYNGEVIEGFVIEDSVGFMTKLKLTYYNFWKFMRGLSHETLRSGNSRKTSALTTPLANEYFGWLKNKYAEGKSGEMPKDICSLRKMFYEETGKGE